MQAQHLSESGFLDDVGHLVGPVPKWDLEIPELDLCQAHGPDAEFVLTVAFRKT